MSRLEEHQHHGSCSYSVSYLESADGRMMIETCDTCGYAVGHCEHTVNDWNDDQTVLTCRMCGRDGT